MVRRSWRDLTEAAGQAAAPGQPAQPPQPAGLDTADLHRIAAQAPGSELADLLAEREQLQLHLASLTGQSGTDQSARYPVASFAERRAEAQAWSRTRDARAAPDRRPDSGTGRREPADPAPEQRASGQLPGDRGVAGRGLGSDVLAERGTAVRSRVFAPIRSGLGRYEDAVAPARNLGRQVTGFADRLDEMDRKLAREGVSKAERDEVRRAAGGGVVDRIAGPLRRADQALERPRQLVDALESRWQSREQQLTAPMDRFGDYATSRDRVLGVDTGGSGDLFERADAARQRALDRRAEQDKEERRAERRHERAADDRAERRRADKQDAERLDRRPGARERQA